MEPSSYKDHLHRPELEGLLEKIVSGVAAIADSENTRDERKKRIVDECNNLRQALQDLLAEYEKNVYINSNSTIIMFLLHFFKEKSRCSNQKQKKELN